MAQLVLGAAGAVVGAYFGQPGLGWAIGSAIGATFEPTKRSYGPKLDDLKVIGADYGQPIAWIAGHPRVSAQTWWVSDRRELSTTTEQGKGGGGGTSYTSYTYECDILWGLCDVEITGVVRVWLNGKMVYNADVDADAETKESSASAGLWRRMTVYTGAADQLPDPTMEAVEGVGTTPAYRGRGSVFMEGLQLGASGLIPNLTFEVAVLGTASDYSTAILDGPVTVDESDIADNPAPATVVEPGSIAYDVDGAIFTAPVSGTAPKIIWSADKLNINSGADPALVVRLACNCQFLTTAGTGTGNVTRFMDYAAGQNAVAFGVRMVSGSLRSYATLTTPASGTVSTELGSAPGGDALYEIVFTVAGTIEWRIDGAKVFETTKARFGFEPQPFQIATAPYVGNGVVTLRISNARIYAGDVAYSLRLVDKAEDTLQNVVETLCARSGMPAGTYDATALAAITKPVRAYTVAQVTSARAVIEQLMSAYFFTAYVTDKIHFVPRAGAAVLTLDADDLGSGIDNPAAELLPITIGSDEEVPAQIALSYSNVDSDYNVATELSDRLLSGVISTSTVPLALGMTSAEAKGIADAILVDQYVGRISGSVALPMAYAELTPSDVVLAPDDLGNLYRVRLVRRTDSGPLLSFDWVLDDQTALTSAGITSTEYTPSVVVALPGVTTLKLLDIPLLRDAENRLGHYVAATSSSASWPGAAVYRGVDGTSYDQAATVSERAVLGVAMTVLPNWTGGGVFDEQNSLTVALTYGTLSSSTRSAMFLDTSVNAMAVGGEIIRFRTATLVSGGTYTVTGLLRGQRGTEWAMGSHGLGETCVLLQPRGLRYVDMEVGDLLEQRFYKGVTLGKTLSSVTTPQTLTSAGVSLQPLSPVQLRAENLGGRSIGLTWKRRTRLASTFVGAAGSVVPLGEATEAYDVELLDAGSNVVQVQTVTTPSASISSAVVVDHLPTGYFWLQAYGSGYLGVTMEGLKWQFLHLTTADGTITDSLFLGDHVWDFIVVGNQAYARITNSSDGTPSFTRKNALYRVDLTNVAGGIAATYDTTVLGDYGEVIYDGTYIWVSEQVTQQLVKLNATTLIPISTHAIGTDIWHLAYYNGDIFFSDQSTNELVRWNIAGGTETWRVSIGSTCVRIHATAFCLFLICDWDLRVFDIATGTLQATHLPRGGGAAASGGVFGELFGAVLKFLDGEVILLNPTNGAELTRVRIPSANFFLAGVVNDLIWLDYQPTNSYNDYDARAYELGADLTGYKVNVYQLSTVVGRGRPATLTL